MDCAQGLADQAADAIEVGCARGLRGGGREGKIGARAIGNFTYKKTAGQTADDPNYEVKIFPLLVRRQSATWPEHGQRVVQWVDPEKAIALIREPELKAIVATFAKHAAAAASKLIY